MSEIIDNVAKSRYELLTEGHLSIASYQKDDNRLIITHVEVPHALRGKGVAAKLMAGIVQDAQTKSLTIVPVCSYAAAYMARHA